MDPNTGEVGNKLWGTCCNINAYFVTSRNDGRIKSGKLSKLKLTNVLQVFEASQLILSEFWTHALRMVARCRVPD